MVYSNFCKQAELKNLEKLRRIMLKILQIVNFGKNKLDVANIHEMCSNLHIMSFLIVKFGEYFIIGLIVKNTSYG